MPPEEDEVPIADAPEREEEDEESLRVTLPPRAAEPMHMLDDAPLPPRYDVDECVAIPVDPRTLYVYWEAREATLALVRAAHPGGALALRLVVVIPTWDGPQSTVRDLDVTLPLGDYFARDLPPGSVVRVALGWKSGDAFAPIAHSPALETPPGGPSPLVADSLVRWTPQGPVPVQPQDADAAVIERALGLVRRDETRARLAIQNGKGFLGSSDRWMRVVERARA